MRFQIECQFKYASLLRSNILIYCAISNVKQYTINVKMTHVYYNLTVLFKKREIWFRNIYNK